MSWLFAAAAVGVTLAVAVCCAAMVEVFRQLAEIRAVLNLQDLPTPLALKAGELQTSAVGLPRDLVTEPQAIVVFLSPKCATCLSVAEAFRGGSPSTVWFVLSSPPTPTNLMETLADSAERVILDENDVIAESIDLNVTPSVLTVSWGEITRAQAVSTPRQVLGLVPTVAPRGIARNATESQVASRVSA
jgi:hypothetical protein